MTHEHLSDEQLSAHLDGEPAGETTSDASPVATEDTVTRGIAACDVCRRRQAALAAARHLVGRPVDPVAPSLRVAAVEAALAEALGPDVSVGSPPPTVVAFDRRGRGWGRGSGVAAVAAAAVLVAVGVSVGLAHRSSSSPSAASTATHGPVARSAGTTTQAELGHNSLLALGSYGSPSTLRARLGPVVASGNLDENSATASTPEAAQPTSAGTSSTSSTKSVSSGQAYSVAGLTPADSTCVSAAAKAAPGSVPTPDLVASLTYKNTPALVVVFASPDAPGLPATTGPTTTGTSSHRAVVVARSGCRVLAHFAL